MATIYYLVGTFAAHPDLAGGTPPAGFLSAAEEQRFRALGTAKRRREWLLGRWTAKRLLQQVAKLELGRSWPLDEIPIGRAPTGAPQVECEGLADILLSISHREECAFCAVSLANGAVRDHAGLGADIERIETRSERFVKDYLTGEEAVSVSRSPADMRAALVTAIWSGKEAALKALGLGLTVDTRAVTCYIHPVSEPPASWAPFRIELDATLLNRSAPALRGWWRGTAEYVMALVTTTLGTPAEAPGCPLI